MRYFQPLKPARRYGEEDLAGAKSLVDQCPADEPDSDINLACLLYKENRYQEALDKFQVKTEHLDNRCGKSKISYLMISIQTLDPK